MWQSLVAGKGFVTAFLKSLGVILASEIGDKTFFIAAVMAMRNPRLTVFAGAIAALALMTVLSAALGWAAPNLINKTYTHYASIALFFFFGLKTLYDGFIKQSEEESELEAVEQELAESNKGKSGSSLKDMDKERSRSRLQGLLNAFVSPIFVKACVLTFVAEWGDRSQIATIGLATSEDVVGVTLGGILGHSICTGAAVLGGRHLAAHINEKAVAAFGGVAFLLFGVHALITGP